MFTIPTELICCLKTRSDKRDYSLSTFPALRAHNFLTDWSFAVIYTHNTTSP